MREHELYKEPTGLSPLLAICYAVAKEAHKGVERTKKNGNIDYITHPVIVYKLLEAIGIKDEITLAASFLHDVREDCAQFKTPGSLEAELAKQFEAAGIIDGRKKAAMIDAVCAELTNAENMAEGKRGWQWEHGHHLSSWAKPVKIADQAASLIDDILLPSDRSYEKLRKFDMKALECAKACAGDNELLDKLFKVIFNDAMVMMDAEKTGASSGQIAKAAEIRDKFSLDEALMRAKNYPAAKADEPPVRWRKHPSMEQAKTGVIAIGLTDDGRVCRMQALVDPHLEEDSPCNSAAISLIQHLESASPMRCTYQPLQIVDERVVREFKVKPPVALVEFLAHAKASNAIEPGFQNALVQATPASLKER